MREDDSFWTTMSFLGSLCVKGETYGLFLTPVILSRLPQDIRLEWALEGEGKEADLQFLLDFLRKEIQHRERSEVFKSGAFSNQTGEEKSASRKLSSAFPLHVSSSDRAVCLFCDKLHPSHKCRKVTRKDDRRRKQIMLLGYCFRCMEPTHQAQSCCKVCAACSVAHHLVLCSSHLSPTNSTAVSVTSSGPRHDQGDSSSVTTPKSSVTTVTATTVLSQAAENPTSPVHADSEMHTLLPVIKVKCRHGNGEETVIANVLLIVVQKDSVQYATFGGKKSAQTHVKKIVSVRCDWSK